MFSISVRRRNCSRVSFFAAGRRFLERFVFIVVSGKDLSADRHLRPAGNRMPMLRQPFPWSVHERFSEGFRVFCGVVKPELEIIALFAVQQG